MVQTLVPLRIAIFDQTAGPACACQRSDLLRELVDLLVGHRRPARLHAEPQQAVQVLCIICNQWLDERRTGVEECAEGESACAFGAGSARARRSSRPHLSRLNRVEVLALALTLGLRLAGLGGLQGGPPRRRPPASEVAVPDLGFGRSIGSETEAPNMAVNLVQSG